MPKFLWVKWNDGGPRCKRFPFLYKVSRRLDVKAKGEGFVVSQSEGSGRGTIGRFELHISEGADLEAAVKAFMEEEGGELREYWVEVEHE